MESSRSIVCIEMKYPYGKQRVFQSGSLIAITARLNVMGYEVVLLDLNIHEETSTFVQQHISKASYICISLTGTPYVPDAIAFARKLVTLGTPILFGGQGAETLSQRQFDSLFCNTNAIRIATEMDLLSVLGIKGVYPSVFEIDYTSVWKSLDEQSVKTYLQNEMTLVISQGCLYRCNFCAAKKNRPEIFRDLKNFESDLRYIAEEAKKHEIYKIKFYASSLDFFQSALVDKNEIMIERVLKIMAHVRKDTGIDIQTRCLSTMISFLKASERIADLGKLLNEAGLNRIGFGVDGSDPAVWKSQKKTHNKPHQILECIEQTATYGVSSEILMVVGFPQDTMKTLILNILSAFRYSKYKNVILRAYMAKVTAPGNDEWNEETAKPFIDDPTRFQQIDYCAFANKATHPRLWHRMMSNICYGTLMVLFSLSGRSVTYPVFPIRGNIFKKRIATYLNDLMPGVD